jgi:anion-transporting  ArsA/GET3 family ATPase
VGKTTTAAALALGMAARGRKVAVVTIDPAPRLATSLGLDELDNEPRRVTGDGDLWAMRLDAKRTFDALIERLAPDPATRDEVLGNRVYQQVSNAVAGSQEFTAIAKLYELDQEGDYDLLVLDTPPSRNALDFLDAPDRIAHFFHGRAVRMFLRPGRLLGRGTSLTFSLLKRVTGVDLLQDLAVFFRSLSGLIDGFTERADRVAALLADPGTTFLIVTSPRHDPLEEAAFFHRKLHEAGLPFGGVIVNRFRREPGADGRLPDGLAAALGRSLAGRVDASARELTALAARDRAGIADLEARLDSPPMILVPELDSDVYDVEGLALVERHIFGDGPSP